jgi:hypothetical protein
VPKDISLTYEETSNKNTDAFSRPNMDVGKWKNITKRHPTKCL